eukprot:606299-Amphidinium_carterae.1
MTTLDLTAHRVNPVSSATVLPSHKKSNTLALLPESTDSAKEMLHLSIDGSDAHGGLAKYAQWVSHVLAKHCQSDILLQFETLVRINVRSGEKVFEECAEHANLELRASR